MEKKKKFIINAMYYAIILALVVIAWKYLVPVFMPFIIAFLISAILNGPARWISRKLPIKRKPLVFLFVALFYVLVFWGIAAGGNRIFTAVRDLLSSLPSLYRNQILPTLNELFDRLEKVMDSAGPYIVTEAENTFRNLTDQLGSLISDGSVMLVKTLSGYVTSIPGLVVKIVITVIATFFIAGDYDKIIAFFCRLLPEKWVSLCREVKNYAKNVIFVYIRSYLLLMLLTFTELTIGLLILRVPYAVWVVLGIAIFDVLPILGTGGIVLPWAAVCAILGNYSLAVGLLILYLIVTAIRNSLEPRIVGSQIGLPPLVTLISLFVGMSLFGLVGLIGFPVLLSTLFNMEKSGVIHIMNRRQDAAEANTARADTPEKKGGQ